LNPPAALLSRAISSPQESARRFVQALDAGRGQASAPEIRTGPPPRIAAVGSAASPDIAAIAPRKPAKKRPPTEAASAFVPSPVF